jgi:starch phosphorylase
MLNLVRERLVQQYLRVGLPPVQVDAARRLLDPEILTIGFARRFATYKRATLIFRDQERLKRILNDPQHPVQIVFAGKAHPADDPGKALIQTICQLSHQPGFAGRIAFVEEYDANLARHLISGVDVWLNNPRRPLEASGTSGQKAGLNGVPSVSVLDGWWSEGYNGQNGWAIGAEGGYLTEAAQDEADALSLYTLLESEIIPLFYARDADGCPLGWLAKMRNSLASVGPLFSTNRMLKEYASQYYKACSDLGGKLASDSFAGARALADWEARVRSGWSRVSLSADSPPADQTYVGQRVSAQALLHPGPLAESDLAVELVYGQPGDGDLKSAVVVPMDVVGSGDNQYRYEVSHAFAESGTFGYGVRVRPQHVDLPNPFALDLVKWA